MTTPILMEFDLSGAEWVVTSYVANEPRRIAILEQGKHPHLVTGSLISGAPEDFVKLESEAVGLSTDPTAVAEARKSLVAPLKTNFFLPRTMSIRQAGKKSNFELDYGVGYRTFALTTGLDERDAKTIQDKYLNVAYPGIPPWWEDIRRRLDKSRTLYSCEISKPYGLHRKQRFLESWGQELFRRAYSFIPQATVGDITNRTMVLFSNDPGLNQIELLGQVHDSLLMQAWQEAWIKLAGDVLQIRGHMSPTLHYEGREFSIEVGLKIGPNWGAMKEVTLTNDLDQLAENLAETYEVANEQSIDRHLLEGGRQRLDELLRTGSDG